MISPPGEPPLPKTRIRADHAVMKQTTCHLTKSMNTDSWGIIPKRALPPGNTRKTAVLPDGSTHKEEGVKSLSLTMLHSIFIGLRSSPTGTVRQFAEEYVHSQSHRRRQDMTAAMADNSRIGGHQHTFQLPENTLWWFRLPRQANQFC